MTLSSQIDHSIAQPRPIERPLTMKEWLERHQDEPRKRRLSLWRKP